MVKNYFLSFLFFCCAVGFGYGQAALPVNRTTWNAGNPTGWTNSGASSYTSSFACSTNNGGRLDNSGEYYQVFFNSASDQLSYDIKLTGNSTSSLLVEESTNGTIWSTVNDHTSIATTCTSFGFPLSNASRYVRWTYTKVSGNLTIDDVEITAISCTDAMDLESILSPTASPQTITQGDIFNVSTQAVEPGVTDANATAAGAGVEAWIGYSSTDDDPSTGTGWTWVLATYSSDIGGNDVHIAEIGSGLTSGTYYYATRHRLNSCGFTYGGTGGFWNNDSVELIVNPDQVDFCNVDFPKTGNITTGGNHNVYAQAYEPGVTDAAGQGANIEAWIGYTTNGINYQPWQATGWTWVAATYDSDANGIQNDQYIAEIGSALPAGTYYYASRFRLNGSAFSYGGIAADNVGNFWDATNNNGTLVVTDPPPADVVITEIMYNTSGTDDEWIEICNESGSAQTLNNYTIEVNGGTEYTFPNSGVVITDGACILVILGDNGIAPFNPNCPFTSIYSNSPAANTLANSSRTITIIAADGSTLVDSVTYNSADGANGNDSTLHVIDINADNSTTAVNWQEVVNGGSAGINQLTPLCLVPDINVEGNIGTFPDIASDGSNNPVGFNNTLFAATAIGVAVPPTKSYRIQNTGGEILNISSITLGGANPGDFTPSGIPTTINPGAFATFTITFDPLAIGERTAIVTIISDDPDGFENPYNFNIKGTGVCTSATIGVSSFAPLDGPVGTEVTITGNGFSAASTVTIGGLPATVVSFSATELVVEIPAITNSGPFTITEGACFTITSDFILTSNNAACGLTELIMSEIYDLNGGSLGYIEVYNGTGNTIDLSSYYVRRYGDAQDFLDNNYVDYYFSPSQDFIADGQALYGKISTDADTATPDFDFANVGGFAGVNGEDIFHLYNATTLIDVYTVPDNNIGYTATRDINTLGPNATENPGDWTHSNSESISDLGTFGYVQIIDRPTIVGPVDVSGCTESVEFLADATAGNIANSLTYQWYYNEGNSTDLNWEVVTTGAFPLATVSGINGDTLTLTGAFYSYSGYQFYCLVTEDAACGIASSAAQLKVAEAVWDGSNWNWNNGTAQDTLPVLSTNVTINGNYNTSAGGAQTSFSACSLTVNSGFNLAVQNDTFVEVENDIVANGSITLQTRGSVVQINDLASVTASGVITVQKETTTLNSRYDYTYWSSPVQGETIESVFNLTPSSRRFVFNANNFEDFLAEVGNTGVYNPGQDDNDDNVDAWQFASGIMTPGVGYAAMPSPAGPFPAAQQYTFVGAFNNGVIQPTVYNNSGGAYKDWNFIGNPYPSAIDANRFFSVNSGVVDAVYLWNQTTPASFAATGNQNANFAGADYAIISASGVNTAGGDLSLIPNDFIPSGQGFFVDVLIGTTVTFNNFMRVTGDNDQFFRVSNTTNPRNVLWLNMTSDNGVAKQIAVAHLEGATDNDDGSYYDVKENLSSGNAANFYSTIPNDDENEFVIQGKNTSSLDENEVINIGFKTIITVPTLYTISIAQFEGDFYTENNIYIKDNLLDIIHNLKDSDYTFSSEAGEFKDRFEIIFNLNALSVDDNLVDPNALTIAELQNGDVQISVGKTHTITNVEIMDITGRLIYTLKGNNSTEVYNLSNLSKAAYIAKITLSNGQIISKKTIKQH